MEQRFRIRDYGYKTEEKWTVKNVRDLGWLGILLIILSAVVTVTAFIVMWRAWG